VAATWETKGAAPLVVAGARLESARHAIANIASPPGVHSMTRPLSTG
jgi:hypothetical protein